jgi:hypothetical protein
MPGIISSIGLDYYKEYVPIAFWWSLIGIYTFIISLWGKRDTVVSFNILKIEKKTRFVLTILTAISAAIFLPKVFYLSDNRFNFLPFFAWGALYNVLSILLVISHKSFRNISSVIHLLLLLFIMARGERADQIMVLLSLFLFMGNESRKERAVNLKYVVLGLSLFLSVSFIGFIRLFGFQNLVNNFSYYLGLSFYAQQTAADVTHVYMSSVYYFFEHSFSIPVMFNLPLSLIPGLPGGGSSASNNYINTLMEVVPSYGGGLFYAESALNFGLFGIIGYVLILSRIIRYGLRANTLISKIVLFSTIILVFRIHWYGLLYLLKPIYISFILIVFLKTLSKSLKDQFLINENSNST